MKYVALHKQLALEHMTHSHQIDSDPQSKHEAL